MPASRPMPSVAHGAHELLDRDGKEATRRNVVKNYTEAKNAKELANLLGIPASEAAKIEMRTDLVVAIRKVVEKKRLTHAEAAKQAGVGRTVMTAILNANTTHISTDRLFDIAQNLGLTVKLRVA